MGIHYKTLITIGNWTIDESLNTKTKGIIGVCHIKCPSSWMRYRVIDLGTCVDCDAQIPEDILGVWLLYNLDNYSRMKGEL